MDRRQYLMGLSAACAPAALHAIAEQAKEDAASWPLSPPVVPMGVRLPAWTLAERMTAHRVPGVALARWKAGRLLGILHVGQAKAIGTAGGPRIGPKTLWQAASLTKPVVAVCAAAMAERGLLNLDADIEPYLGDWSLPREPGSGTHPVSLRQLLSHSAGTSVSGFMGYAPGERLPSLSQLLRGEAPARSEPVRLLRPPGERASYSGGGYLVVQRLLEQVTGQSLATLIQRHVGRPADWRHSTLAQPLPEALARRAATGHDGEGQPLSAGSFVYPELAAAGLWTTAAEMAGFGMRLQRGLLGRADGLLGAVAAQALAQRQVGGWATGFELLGTDPRQAADPREGWALFHTGSNRGFKCCLLLQRWQADGLLVLTNGDGGGSLFQELLAGHSLAESWPVLRPRVRATQALTQEVALTYQARYHMHQPIEATVVVEADAPGLAISVPGHVPRARFFRAEPDQFFDLSGSEVHFLRNAAGKVEALLWDGQHRARRA